MRRFDEDYEVVVVGGGHAGCEAAHAAARMGLSTALYSMNVDLVAQMSCNPAVGGIAKGHLVREIDALGGIMGRVADEAGIQFRLLNTSRGPAVWSPRAQEDKALYRQVMRRVLEETPGLFLKQAEVVDLLIHAGRVLGVELQDGRRVEAKAVILTTGTFLNGLVHIGEKTFPAGRSGEAASVALAQTIRSLGFDCGRLKTGTPPRLDRRTIDFSKFEVQSGDPDPTPFSWRSSGQRLQNKIDCYLTGTNTRIHQTILNNIGRSPLYSGQIQGRGPRYCPSIEDKVLKFQDRDRHQVILEPEGVDTHEVYVNGMSTSLPLDVQREVLSQVPGLESAHMIRPGYAIEYDFVQPTSLNRSLETKKVEGLYFAGQLNGTTGYEEAAAQGLVAGIAAARQVKGLPPLTLDRSQAYIGILVDDLVTLGTTEPYRMFTSRAEFRLHLRIDNADRRLTTLGRTLGLVGNEQWRAFEDRELRREDLAAKVSRATVSGSEAFLRNKGVQLKGKTALADVLRRPEVRLSDALPHMEIGDNEYRREDLAAVETEIKYAGYLEMQSRQVQKLRQAESRLIPDDLEFREIPGLSREVAEKLSTIRPVSIGQASRIPGVTPAAIAILLYQIEAAKHSIQQ